MEEQATGSERARTKHQAAPTTARAPRRRQRKFYVIESAWAGDFPYRLLNDRVFADGTSIFVLPMEGRGFRRTVEPPIFHFIGRRAERDFWQYCSYWFVSDRMKSFLERFDPEAFKFLRCEVKLSDGTRCPDRWLCDVVRVLDAVDEENSKGIFIEADTTGQKYYLMGNGTFVFNEDAVGPHHVFLMMHSPSYVAGDEEFKSACKAAGMKGISFYGGIKHLYRHARVGRISEA